MHGKREKPRRGSQRDHRPGRRPAVPGDPLRLLDTALTLRAPLLTDPRTTACRLFNGAADGLDGLVIEKLADVLVVQSHEGRLALDEHAVQHMCEHLSHQLNMKATYRKVFPRDRSAARQRLEAAHSDSTPWLGQPVEPEFPILEDGLRLLVHAYDGYSTGLFLEHRHNRQRLRELVRGQRVLNAFAYTCGFTVAAAVGGAAATVSVDASKKFLEWGKRNLSVNEQPLDKHIMICADIFDYYRRAQRQGRKFDVIVLDPPTFGRTKHPARVFEFTKDLDCLAQESIALLDPEGLLLLSTNHRATTRQRLEQAVTAAAQRNGRPCEIVARPRLPLDFRGDPDYAKSVFFRIP